MKRRLVFVFAFCCLVAQTRGQDQNVQEAVRVNALRSEYGRALMAAEAARVRLQQAANEVNRLVDLLNELNKQFNQEYQAAKGNLPYERKAHWDRTFERIQKDHADALQKEREANEARQAAEQRVADLRAQIEK